MAGNWATLGGRTRDRETDTATQPTLPSIEQQGTVTLQTSNGNTLELHVLQQETVVRRSTLIK